jgi:hypothetical protein
MPVQTELRIGCPQFDLCELETALAELRLGATIIPTRAVMSDTGLLEPGAIVHLYDCDRRRLVEVVWPLLQRRLGLTCAYISAQDRGFHGCIANYAAVSQCPMAPHNRNRGHGCLHGCLHGCFNMCLNGCLNGCLNLLWQGIRLGKTCKLANVPRGNRA